MRTSWDLHPVLQGECERLRCATARLLAFPSQIGASSTPSASPRRPHDFVPQSSSRGRACSLHHGHGQARDCARAAVPATALPPAGCTRSLQGRGLCSSAVRFLGSHDLRKVPRSKHGWEVQPRKQFRPSQTFGSPPRTPAHSVVKAARAGGAPSWSAQALTTPTAPRSGP